MEKGEELCVWVVRIDWGKELEMGEAGEATAFQAELVPIWLPDGDGCRSRLGFQCFLVLFTPEAVGVARLGFLHFERMFPHRVLVTQQTFVTGSCQRCRLQIIFLPLCGPCFFPTAGCWVGLWFVLLRGTCPELCLVSGKNS